MSIRGRPKIPDDTIVGACDHPIKELHEPHVTWLKARKKCIKIFNDPCKHYVPIKRS